MNLGVLKNTVYYAKEQAAKAGKKFLFTTTTNALLLNDETIKFFNEEMENVVLSLDGRKEVHDAIRKTVNGKDRKPEKLRQDQGRQTLLRARHVYGEKSRFRKGRAVYRRSGARLHFHGARRDRSSRFAERGATARSSGVRSRISANTARWLMKSSAKTGTLSKL